MARGSYLIIISFSDPSSQVDARFTIKGYHGCIVLDVGMKNDTQTCFIFLSSLLLTIIKTATSEQKGLIHQCYTAKHFVYYIPE